jgi:hypothetical protein
MFPKTIIEHCLEIGDYIFLQYHGSKKIISSFN